MRSESEDTEDYELVDRIATDNDGRFDLDEADFGSSRLASSPYNQERTFFGRLLDFFKPAFSSNVSSRLRSSYRPIDSTRSYRRQRTASLACRSYRPPRLCVLLINFLLVACCTLVFLTAIFRPSYSHPPRHYHLLRQRIQGSSDSGRANPENQKIFIAASLFDPGGSILNGEWAQAVLDLVDMLGYKNVYLSIYESESDLDGQTANYEFETKVQCPHSVLYDRSFSMDEIPETILPDGSVRHKRIAFLAEMRNKALLPLEKKAMGERYDKLLFLNDIVFDPIDAVQLLFSTNIDDSGHASYRAACAVDFINPFKFYDTFATRDLEGYSMGIPFYPWFTNAGNGASRRDVLAQKDAVRVKSCWGGMVAFNAEPFQKAGALHFRATEDIFWDASECCLIHADLIAHGSSKESDSTGVYMNPYIRVAYDARTHSWLGSTRRFERLYSIVHNILNHVVGMPWYNPRRTGQSGEKVDEKVWVIDEEATSGGFFQVQSRISAGDGYCGIRMLQLMKLKPELGEKPWEIMPVPPGG